MAIQVSIRTTLPGRSVYKGQEGVKHCHLAIINWAIEWETGCPFLPDQHQSDVLDRCGASPPIWNWVIYDAVQRRLFYKFRRPGGRWWSQSRTGQEGNVTRTRKNGSLDTNKRTSSFGYKSHTNK